MIGSSMMMASFGFMMYAISPAYSNNNDNKLEIPLKQNTSSPLEVNSHIDGDYVYFVEGGYMYKIPKDKCDEFFVYPGVTAYQPKKVKLP